MHTFDAKPNETHVVGIDLGSSAVKVALLASGPDGGRPRLRHTATQPLKGRPRTILADLLTAEILDHVPPKQAAVAVTGYAQGLLSDLVDLVRTNEVVATAAGVKHFLPSAATVLDLGGQFTKWIRLTDPTRGLVSDCALNGLCAAGSGVFLAQQATRLKLDIETLGQMAAEADRGATIAGRCSVFAKSDMIHLQQKGTPIDEIAYGLCLALVRSFVSTVIGDKKVDSPLALVGGGASNPGLVRAIRHVLEMDRQRAIVITEHAFVGAVGAALLGAQADRQDLDDIVSRLRRPRPSRQPTDDSVGVGTPAEPETLTPLSPPATLAAAAGRDEDPGIEQLTKHGPIEAILGVDVGSVSTNLVVLSPELEVLLGVYLATRGRPVEVLAEGLAALKRRFGDRFRILAAGATGSGRHLAERLLGMDVVHNEITAQMVSAAHYFPGVDTIFEIGGQDSKYISARAGRLSAFEMNKICAAGTGSFLEEQAERLGVQIIGEFAERAFESEHPLPLGSRCTVFMDTELVRALQRGATVEDLCAGLAYSIVKNYLEKVVAGRPVGDRIVFSGGTASNNAVVAAFGKTLDRPIHVHPYNRIAGAIGAGMLAQNAIRERRTGPPKSAFRGLDAIRDYTIKTFECRKCPNRCSVNRVTVADRVAHFGDACERYASHDNATRSDAPVESARADLGDLFERRATLLAEHLPPSRAQHRTRIGLPMASLNLELAPLWATLLDELGFDPVLSGRTTPEILAAGGHGLPPEVCLPLKLAAGHVESLLQKGIEQIFFPVVLEMVPRTPDDVVHTCLYAQLIPEFARMTHGARILAPEICLSDDQGRLEAVREIARTLARPTAAVGQALQRAIQVQRSFMRCRRELGRRALDTNLTKALVVMGKSYNCHDPFLNLDLARHLRRLGLFAIPFDMLPLDEVELEQRWKVVPWRFNRDQLRTLKLIETDGRLFPLLVTNFGCGPDAFTLKHLEELSAGRPHLVLEFDEHRGEAGLITRLEALRDEIEEYQKETGLRAPSTRSTVDNTLREARGHRCFIPWYCDHAAIYGALLESGGVQVELLPPPGKEVLQLAEEVGSGKECHPYTLTAAEAAHLARTARAEPGDLFYIPGLVTPCLMCQYGDATRLLLRAMGEKGLKVWDPYIAQFEPLVGMTGLISFYEGLLAVDMLMIAACRFRPYEKEKGSVERAHAQNISRIAAAVRSQSDIARAFAESISRLKEIALSPAPRRPLVGVAGDFYTRINPIGNSGLFARLEAMGCEVWPFPYFSGHEDFSRHRGAMRSWSRAQPGQALWHLLAAGTLQCRADALIQALDPELAERCVEPAPARLVELARPFLGPWTNPLVLANVGKMLDFIDRGAQGVINAIGLNCMVGIGSDGALQAIRRAHPHIPMVTLAYGGTEGPSQKIRLETFVHQVQARAAIDQPHANDLHADDSGASIEHPGTGGDVPGGVSERMEMP
jgi:predicted CoA-substrate-specific enzyme activase